MNKFDNVSSDKKAMTLAQINRMFDAGDFKDYGNHLFTDSELKHLLEIMVAGLYMPQFSAIQLENGEVIFRTGKLQQFVKAALKLADDTDPESQLSPLKRRRIHTATYIEFIVIPQVYNKNMTIDETNYYLAFYL